MRLRRFLGVGAFAVRLGFTVSVDEALPKGIFKNNKELSAIGLSSNYLTSIPE